MLDQSDEAPMAMTVLENIVLRSEVPSSVRSYEVAVLAFRFPAQSRGRKKASELHA